VTAGGEQQKLMITRYRNLALTRLGLGFLMFALLGSLIVLRKFGIPEIIVVLGAILLATAGIILYLRGCITLAEAKGHTGGGVTAAIIVSTFCLPGVMFLLPIVLALVLEDRTGSSAGTVGRRIRSHHHRSQPEEKPATAPVPRRKPHRHRFGSHLERIMYYRRNAILGIYFGLAGIALGVLLVIFRMGLFVDHSNEVVLGMFTFLGGYSAVLAGCWWWLRAKALNEALVFIGLMPLAILFIPFVRLIFVASPALLPMGMVMMPLILIVVVFVLPDQSGVSRKKPWWDRKGTDSRRSGGL
jgi:hypothetical protein